MRRRIRKKDGNVENRGQRASLHRNVVERFVVKRAAELRAFRLNDIGAGLDDDGGGGAGHFQVDGDVGYLRSLHLNSGSHIVGKALGLGLDLIVAGRNRREIVGSRC